MANDKTLENILKKLETIEKRISALESSPKIPKKVSQKNLSVKEFILSKNATDGVQKTLAVGGYLEQFDNMESFNVKDLVQGFRAAKEPPPKNMNDKVNMNVGKGFMMDAGTPKNNLTAWVLTNTGEKVLELGFGKAKKE